MVLAGNRLLAAAEMGQLGTMDTARNHLMKLQGYDSARDFTRRIDEQIARQGAGASESLPSHPRESAVSSEMRSVHTRTRFAPDVLDRTRRQR